MRCGHRYIIRRPSFPWLVSSKGVLIASIFPDHVTTHTPTIIIARRSATPRHDPYRKDDQVHGWLDVSDWTQFIWP